MVRKWKGMVIILCVCVCLSVRKKMGKIANFPIPITGSSNELPTDFKFYKEQN